MAAEFAKIQEKYTAEALKRVKPEGLSQFQQLDRSQNDRLRHLVDDIWADHAALDAQKPALKPGDSPKFLIAGAGLGGIIIAARLIQQGFSADQIRLVETAGGIGGTWYWNRYPGLHCDVEAYIYLPLLEEMGYMPTHKYAAGVEIRIYLKQLVKKYHLEDKVLFRTQMNKIVWDESSRHWKVDLSTGRGSRGEKQVPLSVTAEFVYLGAGLLAKPQIPKLDGLDSFKGDMFHTSLWNYSVTGGSSEEAFPDLSKLKDKRVGIIGTGATAIQAVPCLAEYAKELYVFQRTPSAVFTRGQKPTDPEEWRSSIASRPGWYEDRRINFVAHIAKTLGADAPNLVDDQWVAQPAYAALVGDEKFENAGPEKVPEIIGYYLGLDAPNMVNLRQRVKDIVKDPATAEKLMPWYPAWCKRPCFSDLYLQAFNKDNVHLVDTDGKGCERVTENGIGANGTEYPVDVLIWSTGYTSPAADGGDVTIRAGVKVYGKGGRDFSEKVTTDGVATLFGVASNGFPNLFWLGPTNAGVSPNFSMSLDVLASAAAHMIGAAHDRVGDKTKTQGGVTVEVDTAAEEAWTMRCAMNAARFAVVAVCTPGYVTSEQGPGSQGQGKTQAELFKDARRSPWPLGMPSFVAYLKQWEADGKLEGVTVTAA
ncbi:FAD/NAD(P)-binding domain-containing protein [Xylariaceae sp. FL0255]|nr:FAD/NAD(P)-binding domain-containing protein [Xylariaceae sp. FL0255]